MKSIPHICPTCCEEMVEVEGGRVQGFYGRLVFPADPQPYTCPNCKGVLVPSQNRAERHGQQG